MNIAAIQLEVSDISNKAERFKIVDEKLREIKAGSTKPDLVMLPETWGCGFFDFDNYLKESEPLNGDTFQLLSSWAKDLEAYIHGGSIIEVVGNNLFNTSILINKNGEIEATYRKMHLWGYQSKEIEML